MSTMTQRFRERLKKRTTAVEHSGEDAVSLLDTLILVSAFFLAFCLQLMTAFEHGDLLEADSRFVALWAGESRLLSVDFLQRGYMAATFLISGLFLGVVMMMSFSFSNAREDPQYFDFWFRVFKPLFVVAYICLIVGTSLFIRQSHLAVEMMYPRYNLANWRTDGRLLFNSTTQLLEEKIFAGAGNGASWATSDFYLYALTSITIIVFVSVPLASLALHEYYARKTRTATERMVPLEEQHTPLKEFLRSIGSPHHLSALVSAGFSELHVLSRSAHQSPILLDRWLDLCKITLPDRVIMITALQKLAVSEDPRTQ